MIGSEFDDDFAESGELSPEELAAAAEEAARQGKSKTNGSTPGRSWVDNGPAPGEEDDAAADRIDMDSNTRFGPQPGTGEPAYLRLKPYRGLMSSAAFIASMTKPDYLVKGMLLRGSTFTLTGNTGHCKTLQALLLAIRVAQGGGFYGYPCRKGTVVIFAGENPDNVKLQFYAMCKEYKVDPQDISILWHEGTFSIQDAMAQVKADLAKHPDLSLVVFDSLQAFFTGEDDNSNVAMLKLAFAFREVSAGHRNKPVGLIITHPVKRAPKDNLLPRGGSAVTNELDGNLTVWSDGDYGELHWQGKFRGPPFDPIKFEVARIQPEGLEDEDGDRLTISVVRSMPEGCEAELRNKANNNQLAVLAAIHADKSVSNKALMVSLQLSRHAVDTALRRLTEGDYFRSYIDGRRLTSKGKTMLTEPVIQPAETAHQ